TVADDSTDRVRLSEAVATIVMAELRLPAGAEGDPSEADARQHARQYFQESEPLINGFLHWKYFRDLIGRGRLRWLPVRVTPFVEQVRKAWPVGPEDRLPGAAGPPKPMA